MAKTPRSQTARRLQKKMIEILQDAVLLCFIAVLSFFLLNKLFFWVRLYFERDEEIESWEKKEDISRVYPQLCTVFA